MEVPLALPWTPLCSDLCKIPGGEEEEGVWRKKFDKVPILSGLVSEGRFFWLFLFRLVPTDPI